MNRDFAMPSAVLRAALRPAVPVILAAIALGAGATGCDMGLQETLDKKKAERWEKAESELRMIEQRRVTLLEEGLAKVPVEPPKELDGSHPIYRWRAAPNDLYDEPEALSHLLDGAEQPAPSGDGSDSSASDKLGDAKVLEALAEHYRGTPTEDAALAGAAYVNAATEYWAERESRKKTSHERYKKFLRGYLAEAETTKKEAEEAGLPYVTRPFLAEAAFDLVFVHGARLFDLYRYSEFAQLTTAFPYWQLAFEYPSRTNESFSDYVTRVCRVSELKEKCKGVPHEYRPQAINMPYMEWLKGQVAEFDGAHDSAPLKDVAGRMTALLDKQIKELPDFTEDPFLPASRSSRPASTGLFMVMSPKRGVRIATGDPSQDVVVAEDYSGKTPAGLAAKAAERIGQLKDEPGNTVDFERIVVEAPGDLPGKEFGKLLAAFPRNLVRQFELVGRRRVDESLRRTGLLLRVPAEDEGATTSYALSNDEDAERTTCDYVGLAGKPPIGRKSPGSYLIVGNDKVNAIKLDRDPETRALLVKDQTLDIARSDDAALQKWADDNPGIVRLFITRDMPYTDLVDTVSGLLYKCVDTSVVVNERTEEKLTVPCGKSELRDITLVVGLCK